MQRILVTGGAQDTLHAGLSDAESAALGGVTQLYYFASPKIVKNEGAFDESIAASFRQFYVIAFEDCVTRLAQHAAGLKVFYPSSVFITDSEPGFAEYIVAKKEGEALCDRLNRSLPRVRVTNFRLPKLATDQTLSLIEQSLPDTVATLLEAYTTF